MWCRYRVVTPPRWTDEPAAAGPVAKPSGASADPLPRAGRTSDHRRSRTPIEDGPVAEDVPFCWPGKGEDGDLPDRLHPQAVGQIPGTAASLVRHVISSSSNPLLSRCADRVIRGSPR